MANNITCNYIVSSDMVTHQKYYIQLMCSEHFVWHLPYTTRGNLLLVSGQLRRTLTYCLGLLAQARINIYDGKPLTDVLLEAACEMKKLRLVTLVKLLTDFNRPISIKNCLVHYRHAIINTAVPCPPNYPLPPKGQCLAESLLGLEQHFENLHKDCVSASNQEKYHPSCLLKTFREKLRHQLLPACDGIWMQSVKIDEICYSKWTSEQLLAELKVPTGTRFNARYLYSDYINQAVAVNVFFPDSMLSQANKLKKCCTY